MPLLSIKNLVVAAGGRQILTGLSLDVPEGQTVVIMGPNGSGKSTLAHVLMGHPSYELVAGEMRYGDQDLAALKPEERAALGLFLSFQQPREIPGVDFYPYLYEAYKTVRTARGQKALAVFEFKECLDKEAKALHSGLDWGERYLNQGFSGGEKKKSEMLQLALLQPSLAILDEIDSGLDVDALKEVGRAIRRFKKSRTSLMVVTHYPRLLEYIAADQVVVMAGGKIVERGGPELVRRLEKEGFAKLAGDHEKS